jgi:hypothetical protein
MSFDKHQFVSRFNPVSANVTADGWASSGISYDDYSGMHMTKGKQAPERRLETPEWALSDEKLRVLLVRFIEMRAGRRVQRTGKQSERLEHAAKAIIDRIPDLIATLERNCARYVKLKNAGAPENEIKQLGAQIEGIDTQIRLNQNGFVAKAASVVYLYYRCKMNSIEVGAELDMKPPHVRQTLWRLHKAWEQIQEEEKKAAQPSRHCSDHENSPITSRYICTRTPKWNWPVKPLEEIPLDTARVECLITEARNPHYEGYARYCARLGVNPMNWMHWHLLQKVHFPLKAGVFRSR